MSSIYDGPLGQHILRAQLARIRRERRTMTIRDFIRENRAEIDAAIKRACPNCEVTNDKERRMWVLNDEGLYNWARRSGVKI